MTSEQFDRAQEIRKALIHLKERRDSLRIVVDSIDGVEIEVSADYVPHDEKYNRRAVVSVKVGDNRILPSQSKQYNSRMEFIAKSSATMLAITFGSMIEELEKELEAL